MYGQTHMFVTSTKAIGYSLAQPRANATSACRDPAIGREMFGCGQQTLLRGPESGRNHCGIRDCQVGALTPINMVHACACN